MARLKQWLGAYGGAVCLLALLTFVFMIVFWFVPWFITHP